MVTALMALAIWTSIGWQFALTAGQMGELWCRLGSGSDRVERFWRACARLHQEAWLFAPPGWLVVSVQAWHARGQSWMIFFYAYSLYSWWHNRDWPEDNHWKKRGKKLRDAVKVRAGRLVVVPAGSAS